MTRTAWIEGIALWGSRFPGWELARAVLRGEARAPQAPAPRPLPALLPANERRRAPDSVAIALEVAAKACAAAGRDPRSVNSVFASTHGDLAVTDYMCETLAHTPAQLSPTKFHNSVHNAAAGYWTIATGCKAPYTSLSARAWTFAEGLLEALVQADCDATAVLYVAYDIEACGPLATMAPSRGMLGAGLVLAARRSPRAQALLRWELREQDSPRAPAARHTQLAAGNAMAGCLPLFEALARDASMHPAPERLAYPLGPGLVLALEIGAESREPAPPV
ncbi:MAG TPA: beta-ketoacyl synthase chain length factor [Burkholderiales bacterium]|jgi:hypothetical protein